MLKVPEIELCPYEGSGAFEYLEGFSKNETKEKDITFFLL